MYCAKSMVPVFPDRFESSACRSRPAETTYQVDSVISVLTCTEHEDDLALLSIKKVKGDLDSSTGV